MSDPSLSTEMFIENITETILHAMDDLGISRAELARRMGKSRSHITQLLSGERNMTIHTIGEICYALNYFPRFSIVDDTGDTIWSDYV